MKDNHTLDLDKLEIKNLSSSNLVHRSYMNIYYNGSLLKKDFSVSTTSLGLVRSGSNTEKIYKWLKLLQIYGFNNEIVNILKENSVGFGDISFSVIKNKIIDEADNILELNRIALEE